MISRLKIINIIIILLLPAQSLFSSGKTINTDLLNLINTDGDEISCTFSPDRKQIVFARKPKGAQSSDLYFSTYTAGKWSVPEPITELNSEADDFSPFFSNNGKTIYFSSNRQGSLKSGNSAAPSYDIYYSEKKGGKWDKPAQIFGAVNTMDDELSPSVSKNGKTLYFTREISGAVKDSRPQIIKVTKKNDSWEDVQAARISSDRNINISMAAYSAYRPLYIISGYKNGSTNRDIYFLSASADNGGKISEEPGLNSDGDEISFCELSGKEMIISTNSGGISGSYDLFLKKISAKTPPRPSVSDITIKTESKGYENPDGAEIEILYFTSKTPGADPLKTETKQPDSNGEIKITVTSDIKRIIAIPGNTGMKEFALEIFPGRDAVTPFIIIEPKVEKEFRIRPVYFEFNSTALQIADIPYLHDLIDYLRTNETIKISVQGYADGAGSLKSNANISLARAETVKDYLVKRGISKNRIQSSGQGFVKGAPLDTSQFNRRVEFIITE